MMTTYRGVLINGWPVFEGAPQLGGRRCTPEEMRVAGHLNELINASIEATGEYPAFIECFGSVYFAFPEPRR